MRGTSRPIPVIDKSKREDGTFIRADFTFDKDRNVYVCPQGKLLHTTGRIHDWQTVLSRDIYTCPAGKTLTTTRKVVNDEQLLYRASKLDYDVACPLKCDAARRRQSVKSHAASTRAPAMLLVRSAKPRL